MPLLGEALPIAHLWWRAVQIFWFGPTETSNTSSKECFRWPSTCQSTWENSLRIWKSLMNNSFSELLKALKRIWEIQTSLIMISRISSIYLSMKCCTKSGLFRAFLEKAMRRLTKESSLKNLLRKQPLISCSMLMICGKSSSKLRNIIMHNKSKESELKFKIER